MSSSEKVPVTLKAGEYIVAERGIDNYPFQPATRWTVFVGRKGEPEPHEIFSDAHSGVQNGGPEHSSPSLQMVDDVCSPQCTLGIDRSPQISGIRLGMSVVEFKKLLPRLKIHRLHRNVVNYRLAYLWGWEQDAYNVRVAFLDDKVARIEASIRSLDGKRGLPDFFELVAEKIKLPFWPRYRSGWECREFMVDVLTNEQPTITIQTKAFIKVQAMLAERDIKRSK